MGPGQAGWAGGWAGALAAVEEEKVSCSGAGLRRRHATISGGKRKELGGTWEKGRNLYSGKGRYLPAYNSVSVLVPPYVTLYYNNLFGEAGGKAGRELMAWRGTCVVCLWCVCVCVCLPHPSPFPSWSEKAPRLPNQALHLPPQLSLLTFSLGRWRGALPLYLCSNMHYEKLSPPLKTRAGELSHLGTFMW